AEPPLLAVNLVSHDEVWGRSSAPACSALVGLIRERSRAGWSVVGLALDHQDKAILRQVLADGGCLNSEIVGPKFEHVLRAISTASVVVAARLHALVFGAGLAKPVVGLAYRPKVYDFMKSIGLEESCV